MTDRAKFGSNSSTKMDQAILSSLLGWSNEKPSEAMPSVSYSPIEEAERSRFPSESQAKSDKVRVYS
jgi:hypothetical protein